MQDLHSSSLEHIDILQLRYPRLTKEEAVAILLERIGGNTATGLAIPDMSTVNQLQDDPRFKELLRRRFLIFNDGAGMQWVSRRLGKPFPANLNGTDLTPLLMSQAPKGTRVYVIGAKPGRAQRAMETLAERYPDIAFVGSHHGYFSQDEEPTVIQQIRESKPDIVMVGMGNPLQCYFIDRQLDDPTFRGVLFLAIGGFLNYLSDDLQRAPVWMRRFKLEWFYIVLQQPSKLKRYFVGIPKFMLRCLWAEFRNQHALPSQQRESHR
ncbi:MAG: WecB/TagA/CpsF family glycosyltransferase [Magnetococcales bacterium]|nr:WecB/TagA/CpsF family glycosyltransferase [Magnetococcales bacterium]